jgi:putative FmdB family regulatory protein
MPIYEYVCPSCDLKFEILRPISQATEPASCPRCQKSAKRVLSTFASFSKDEGGLTSSIGGSSCSSCGATSCDTCGL